MIPFIPTFFFASQLILFVFLKTETHETPHNVRKLIRAAAPPLHLNHFFVMCV